MSKKPNRKTELELQTDYVEFLRKRLASKNYRDNSTPEEYAKTKLKYDKAKFLLKTLLARRQ